MHLPFPTGHKVVCINDRFPPTVYEFFDRVPVKGGVYTIHEVFWAEEFRTGRMLLSVRLTELPALKQAGVRNGISLWRFRLLADGKAQAAAVQSTPAPLPA